MSLKNKLINAGLGAVLNVAFRPGYSPKFMRKNFDRLAGISAEKLKQKFPKIEILEESFDGTKTETIRPGVPTKKKILYLHGGGYFMGSLASYRRNALRIAYRCKAEVILVDYRLAPEFPFPTALDDVRYIYRTLLQRFSAEEMIVGGDSAGGGLALALIHSLKDENLALPSAVFCLSPCTDVTSSLPSYDENRRKDVWLSRKNVGNWMPWYCGKADPKNPYISPYFGDFKGFPPTMILVGDQEVLWSDGKLVVDKINEAGGKATLVAGIGMQHNWPFSLPFLEESRAAMDCLAEFVEKS